MKYKTKHHPIYSHNRNVVISRHQNKIQCLEEAVKISGFIDHVKAKMLKTKKSLENFHIVIKPNIMTAFQEFFISSYTDPYLVEHLIKLLYSEGFRKFTIVESQMSLSTYYQNRSVQNVADMVGYSLKGYDLVDVTMTRVDHNYGENELGHHVVGPVWGDADYRISFAKNKTHYMCYYTGCLKNIYGCLLNSFSTIVGNSF